MAEDTTTAETEEIIEALDSTTSDDTVVSDDKDDAVVSEDTDNLFDDSEVAPLTPEEEKEEDGESDEDAAKDKKKDEKKEDEEGEEDEDEDEDEDKVRDANIIKEAATKYKGIFKEFPQLKGAYYRDREFSKVFPTPEAANEAAQDVEIYNQVQREFINGKPEALVKFFEDHKKPETLIRFGRNLLDSVGKQDKNLWAGILFPSITGILRDAENAANGAGNKNLAASVKHLTNYLFGQIDIPADKLPAETRDVNDNNEQVAQLIHRQKINFQDEVYEAGAREAYKVIDASLATLKCKPALKKAITKELFDKVTRAVGKDSALQSDLQSRWSAALRAGLGHKSKASIIDTYLAGVKNKLAKTREQVLKSNGFTIKKGTKKLAAESASDNGSNRKEPDIVDNRPGKSSSSKPGERRDKNDLRGLTDLQKLDRLIGPVK
jgi:hypothetical protein